MADEKGIKDIIHNLVGNGHKDMSDEGVQADFMKMRNLVGPENASKVFNHVLAFNRSDKVKGKDQPDERVNTYNDHLSNNKELAGIVSGGGNNPPPPKDKPNPTPAPKPPAKATPPERIPLPDYKDPASRKKYAEEFHKKYGELTSGLGDTPLRINEKAFWASDTGKNLSVKAASQFKLDPALLYTSAMVEGMSGLYPDEKNTAKSTGDKEYPVSGLWSFGLDSFDKDKAAELIKKGYLPADFNNQFKIFEGEGGPMGKGYKKENAMFKTTDAGLQAKAAMLKESYDDIDAYAKKRGIKLSPKSRDFFALADFNGGEGVGYEMLTDYNNNGLLKNDAYLKERPTKGKGLKETSYKDVYNNVKKRIVVADALKKEGYFDN